jgi:hypothetical protein
MALPSQMFHEIKHTKSSSRPGITRHKKLSKASEKKGVHFDSSHTSDEDGETSQIDVQHTRELETEEVTVSTSGGKYSGVKIPCNVKNNLLDVKVKLYDISVLGKDVPGILSQLNTSENKAFLRNVSSIHNRESPPQDRDDIASYREPTYNSDGRTSPHKEMDTASEGLRNCLSPHDSGNSFRDMSLSHAVYIKHLVIKQEDLSDTECASICSVSTVMAPQTTSCKEEKDDDDADKEYFEFMDSVSVQDEDVHTQGTYLGGENEDLSTGITGETWKNAMVIFPSDSDRDNSLLEISELGAAAEKPESHRQSNPTTNLYRSNECTIYNTQKAITKHSPGLRKRKRACTELVESTDTDSDSSGNSDDTRFKLNTISKRRKCDSKENGISLDNHCLPHPCCPSYINNIDARNDQPALISGCSCNPDNASSDRLGIMAGYVSEPNMQQSDTQTRNWPQVSLAPTLLTCSVVESLANKKQVASGHDKHIKKKNDSATLAEESKSEMRDSNITLDLENGKTSETADCSRNIIFNEETITSEICDSRSFEEPHQAVVSLGLSQNEREDKMPCNTIQDGEMFITDSGSIKNVHSDESKEVSAGGRKHISSKQTFELGKKSNVSNCGSKNRTELSSSRNTAVKDSTNVYKSYSLKNGSSCENAGPKNESPFANDSLLWNNNDYETGTVQSTGQNIAIVITDKSNNYENIRDVRNIRHSSKDSNRTLISESEACRCPGSHITCNPSTNEVDRNYWTNGNRTPFAIVEVFLAAQKLSFQKDFLSVVASETFSNSSDDGGGEDGNCQQKQMVVPPLVLNLKHSIQQGKQLKVPLSTEHPECHYKCSTQKNTLIEQRAQKKWREIKCEETHTFYSLARPVSDHAFCEASSGRSTSRDTFSDSNRINDSGKTAYNISSVPLDLYSLEESSIGLSPCSIVSNTGTTCEQIINDHGIAPTTPEGSSDLQGECGVVPEEFERSHDLLGERGIVPKTSGADDLQGECGVVPKTSGADDLQGECGVVPNTSGADDLQGECGVVPKTSGADDLQGECGVVPKTSGADDLQGACGFVPETSGADDLQGECGVVPEEFERSHDLLGERGIVPETTGADDLPGECGVVPATSQISHDLLCENGVAHDMSEISDNLPNKTIVSSETQEGSDDLIGRKRSAPEIAKGSDSLLYKNGVASETPEGSDCLLDKNIIASETPEGSDYFLGECGVVLETPEGSDCLLDKHGVSSETLEGSDYFLGECGVVPETPEGSDCLLDKHGVASETPEGSDYFLGECGVVPETPEGSDCLLDEHGVACKTPEGSDDLLNKSGVASQTPKGSDELLGKNRVTSEVPERSDNFVGDYQFLSETPEGSYHLLGGNGVPSEKSEGSNDLLGKSRIIPETSERSDDLLRRSSVALETPQKSDNLHGDNDHDIVPDTSGGNTVTTEAYSSSDELSLSSLMGTFQGARKEKCEQIMQIKSSMFLDLMQRKTLPSNEVLKCIVVRKEDECSKKLGTIWQITALRKKFDDCFIKTAVLNDHMYYNGDIYFDRKGMSLDENADIRKLLPTAHIVNKFSSTSAVLDSLNRGQNPDGRLNQCKRNELSNPSILPIKEVKTELPVSFTERNVAEGKEEGRKRTEVYVIPSDDMFPSHRVMHVTKTYERIRHSQDTRKYVIQNSQNSDMSSGDNMFPSDQVMHVNKTYGRTTHSQDTRKYVIVIKNSQNSDISDDNMFPSDRVMHVKSNMFLDLMQRKTLPSNEKLQSNVVKKEDECSEELGTIRQVTALRKNVDDCFTKRAILNDHKYYKGDIDFDRKGMSDKNADIRKLLPTAPIVNKFSSTSGVLDSLNHGQNPHGRLHQCRQNELSNPSILPVKEVKTELPDDSFTERNNVAEGKEEGKKRTEVYAIPSDDDMFPSDQEMHVPKTHLYTIQDDIKRVIQNSQKSLTLQTDSPSETHSRQWKSSRTFKVIRKFIVNRSTLQEHLKAQRQVRFVSILKPFKRKCEKTSSEYSSSVYKHRRVSDAT